MLKVLGCITQQHDPRLVVTAGLICFLACFTAVNMLWRSKSHHTTARAAWLTGAALVFGIGVWTTHFVAMLAFRSDLLIGYSAFETALSLIIVCTGTGAMFWVFALGQHRRVQRALAGMLLGVVVGAMHFVGTNAMRFNGSAL